jgi:hypothetical protein
MEAFLKEGGGGDHLTVRVKLPSGNTQTPLMKNLYTRPPVGKLALYRFHYYMAGIIIRLIENTLVVYEQSDAEMLVALSQLRHPVVHSHHGRMISVGTMLDP